ncbi:hypothetical protein [Streptomyces sp. NPDC014894]|uniref:hypothetical protein n=1 Tax=unclassified Streptomyces TaxID=2593676 RepID=UPI0036FD477B
MQAELATLATTGATALVGVMVSDAWAHTRDRVARFFPRGTFAGSVDEELEASREQLIAARDDGDPEAAADVEDEWRLRLRRALRENPAAAEELRLLLEELAPHRASGPVVTVHNSVSGGVQHGPVIQGEHFSGLTFHTPDGPRPGPGS